VPVVVLANHHGAAAVFAAMAIGEGRATRETQDKSGEGEDFEHHDRG